MAHNRPDLQGISTARWAEMYWSAPYPSCASLARKLDTTGNTVRAHLRAHGLRVRSHSEQKSLDYSHGRITLPRGNYRPIPTPETLQRALAAMAEARKRPAWRGQYQAGMARHRTILREKLETRPCCWCGAPISRMPSRFKHPRASCNVDHGCAFSRHMRRSPNAPRPLILDALRAGLQDRPLTDCNIATIAQRVGAGEAEIATL